MMRLQPRYAAVALAALALASCGGPVGVRDAVRAVGSSTVYPFAKLVAENFSLSNPEFKSPIIEANGTGSGINLFCAGLGANTPDIVNASRRMKASEFEKCVANGVDSVTEVQVGLDGIAFGAARNGITMDLSPEIVYRALAAAPYGKAQTAQLWSDVDPTLPKKPILVYGPPSTSGTRDALKELILLPGCNIDPAMKALKDSASETDNDRHEQLCTEVRSDGRYVDQGEQDNLIVQKIEANPSAVGIFGFSYLEENIDKVQGLPMNGVAPTYANISSFAYPGARPLYIYVKNAHVAAIRGLREFVGTWALSWEADGPLTAIGLVTSPPDVAARNVQAATEFTPLKATELK